MHTRMYVRVQSVKACMCRRIPDLTSGRRHACMCRRMDTHGINTCVREHTHTHTRTHLCRWCCCLWHANAYFVFICVCVCVCVRAADVVVASVFCRCPRPPDGSIAPPVRSCAAQTRSDTFRILTQNERNELSINTRPQYQNSSHPPSLATFQQLLFDLVDLCRAVTQVRRVGHNFAAVQEVLSGHALGNLH